MNIGIVEPCSARIKKALSIRSMTQSELCAKAKISKSTLSEYLKGRYEPKQDKVFIMSQALNVDPVWLMGYDVPMDVSVKAGNKTKKAPDELMLTEGEKAFIKLLRKLPASELPIVYEKILTALDGQE